MFVLQVGRRATPIAQRDRLNRWHFKQTNEIYPEMRERARLTDPILRICYLAGSTRSSRAFHGSASGTAPVAVKFINSSLLLVY